MPLGGTELSLYQAMHEQRKLREAEYFYSQMQKTVADYDAFAFNFSAFLSAVRSVMQYALDEAKTRSGGQLWYDNLTTGKRVLRFFKDMRNFNIHVQPLDLRKSVTVHDSAILTITGNLTVEKFDAQGNLVERLIADDASAPVNVQSQPTSVGYRYTLQEWSGPEDILSLSRTYLDEVAQLVADGIAQGYITG